MRIDDAGRDVRRAAGAAAVEHAHRQDLHARRRARDTEPVPDVRGDDPGDEGAVPELVVPAVAAGAHEVGALEHRAGEVLVVADHAAVDDRDGDAGALRRRPRVGEADRVERPLAGAVRVSPRSRAWTASRRSRPACGSAPWASSDWAASRVGRLEADDLQARAVGDDGEHGDRGARGLRAAPGGRASGGREDGRAWSGPRWPRFAHVPRTSAVPCLRHRRAPWSPKGVFGDLSRPRARPGISLRRPRSHGGRR